MNNYTVEILDDCGKSIKNGNSKHALVGQDADNEASALQLVKDAHFKFCGEIPKVKIFQS